MRPLYFLSLVLLVHMLWPGSAQSGTLRIALVEHSQVRSDTIFLSDLLPQNAPEALRDAASKISLGAAPQNGTSREISQASILATLAASGFSPSSFLIPEKLTVERASHQVTREEVYAAIQQALAKNDVSGLPPFQLADLSFDAAVFVPDGRPELEVTQMAFDEFIGRARFRLWTRSAPEVHPFFATARGGLGAADVSSFYAAPRKPAFPAASRESQVAQAYLVETNRLARLHLHSPNANLLLEVKTLQRGRLGDVIRVRLPGNGKTLLATVVGSESLDASF